jgi:hypothetical protein
MPAKRLRNRFRDPAQLAKSMIDIASGEIEDRPPTPEEQAGRAARPGPNPWRPKSARR